MSKKLNSYEALKDKKAEILAKDKQKETVEVRVAMATCAIATGAKDVLDAIERTVTNEGLLNVHVKHTGCLGYCYAEPTVEVLVPGQESVVYGFVDEKLAMDIVSQHVKDGKILSEHTVDTCHVSA